MREPRRFYVYIMTNRSRSRVLYTGITGNLQKRVFQHKNKLIPGFTSRYNLTGLVYYEQFVYPDAAIAREKEIKGWRRSKKIRLDRIDESSVEGLSGTLLKADFISKCTHHDALAGLRNYRRAGWLNGISGCWWFVCGNSFHSIVDLLGFLDA